MALFLANLARITVCVIAVILTVGVVIGALSLKDVVAAATALMALHSGASALLDGGSAKQ